MKCMMDCKRLSIFLGECKDSYEHDGLVWIPKDEVNDVIDLLEELKDED